MRADYGLFEFVQSLTGNPVADRLMVASAEYLIVLVPVCLVAMWLGSHREASLLALSTVLAALAAATAFGVLYSHPTPYVAGYETILREPPENSFPSTHTTILAAAAAGTLLARRWYYGGVLLVAALLTGVARVYVGLHFPLDVAGSFLAAGVGLGGAYLARAYIERCARWAADVETRVRRAAATRFR